MYTGTSIYARLIVLTIGTLLPFFWIVVILGHRRQRNFERIFFFLCLALVFFFGGSLLAVNAQLYYQAVPLPLQQFAWALVSLGLWALPSLLVYLQIEYARIRELLPQSSARHSTRPIWLWLIAACAPTVLLLPRLYSVLSLQEGQDFLFPSNLLGRAFQIWLVSALVVSAFWQGRFASIAPDKEQALFHKRLAASFALLAFLVLAVHLLLWRWPAGRHVIAAFQDYLLLFAVAPLFDLLRHVQKFNFLQIGRQRNLLYAVFAAFVGLLYLSFVRRVGQWLESYFPPEATAALLLFLPVVLFEPLQRLVGRVLLRAAQSEMDQANRTMGPIQDAARLGNVEKLRSFAEEAIIEQLQLAHAELLFDGQSRALPTQKGPEELFPIKKGGRTIGVLRVRPYGAMLSGETSGALEFLCEQLPAAFDLCHLIEEKLSLERELAERERLAALGRMAASVSHNLKNPLGSIKTILQLQLESPDMPDSLKAETTMVLAEISRLSNKLGQLLQFSRPAVLEVATNASCDIKRVVEDVVNTLRPEAAKKRILLGYRVSGGEAPVEVGAEVMHDVLSNLVVNAIEASPEGGEVKVELAWFGLNCALAVEDEGDGISTELRERVFQPFFTTKARGTGLGLNIVAKYVEEFGGELTVLSPARDGKGTRFEVKIWPRVLRRGKTSKDSEVSSERRM